MTEVVLGFVEPTIEITKRTEEISIEAIVAPLDTNDNPIYELSRSQVINLTDLPLLKLRSTFSKGEMGNNHIPCKNSVKLTITLNPASYSIKRLKEIPEIEGWFSKTSNLSFQKLQHMNVLAVQGENTNNKLFLIPSTVTANYYMGHTLLIKEAFKQTPTPLNNIYDPELTYLKCAHPYIHLKPNVPFKLAPHIVRYKLDPYANNVFKNIHQKSFFSSTEGQPASFYMRPPINQKVNWVLDCVRSNSHNVVWVTQIISCDSSFPFSSLIIGRDEIKRRGKGKNPYKRKKRRLRIVDPTDRPIRLGETTNPIFETVEIETGDFKNEYPGLKDIKFNKIKTLITKDKKNIVTTLIDNREIAVHLATGPNSLGDSPNIVPTEIANLEELELFESGEDESEEDDFRLENFISLIDVLMQSYSMDTIQLKGAAPLTTPLDENVIPYSNLTADNSWCREYKISRKEFEEKPYLWDQAARRFIIKKAVINNVCTYIVEFIYWSLIDKGCTLILTSLNEIDDDALLTEVIRYTRSRSRWANTDSTKEYKLYKLSHNDSDHYANNYAAKIIALASRHTKEQ